MGSDRLHRALLNNLNAAVLLIDVNLRVTYANSAAESLLQTGISRLVGSCISDVFLDKDACAVALEDALSSANPHTRRHEYIKVSVSNETTQVDYTVSPLEIENEKVLLMEMQPIDRFLKINREEAILSVHDTSKSLIRGLAHEIKNPLGGIRGAAQLLDKEILELGIDGEAREFCHIISKETDRLRSLVDRLLGPNKVPKYDKINIHEVTEHVASLIEAEMGGRFTIGRDYDPSIPHLKGDRSQLIQAVLNVGRNAMQAVLESELVMPSITFKSRIQPSFTIGGERHKVVCRVDIIDNGPGIPRDIAEQIFFPMISGRPKGSGLGLTIAQTAINTHQGIIECNSEFGNTIFSIYLPIRD